MRIYLSLGANLGNRGETLREALRRLGQLPQSRLLQISPFYETAPWGKLDQPGFINAVALVETQLSVRHFLWQIQQIEQQLGRVRHEHWGARTIDIDLLAGLDGDTEVCCADPALRLPHPYLTERAFVLIPLRDIAPELMIRGRSVRTWCQQDEIQQQSIQPAAELNEPYPLRLIACVDAEVGLGRDGRLLAQLPEDMARFRQLTQGQVVIMGRRTMESLPGQQPLPDRINIVLTQMGAERAGFQTCRSLPELWQLLGQIRQDRPDCQLWGIGGAAVYQLLLPYAYQIELTRTDGLHDADVWFPSLRDFRLVHMAAGGACRFCTYERSVGLPERDGCIHGNLS